MKLRIDWMTGLLVLVLAAPIGCGDDDDGHDHPDGDHDTEQKDSGISGNADGGKQPTGNDDELEVAGEWKSEFGDQTISVDDWDSAMVVEFDNDENVAFTKNPDDAMYNPGTFGKLVWTEPTDEGFYYCTVDFNLDSLAEAKATEKTADDSDPESMGSCGDFTWTKLEPR